LRFALKGERPGQIVYMCETVGLQVTAMKRLRIGQVPLSDLPVLFNGARAAFEQG
jgi:23S rRNA pseudouridine2604 synthase